MLANAKLFNMISLAYALGAHAFADPHNAYGYQKQSLGQKSPGVLLKLQMLWRQNVLTHQQLQALYIRDGFRPWEEITISRQPSTTGSANHVQFPVQVTVHDTQIWQYDLDDDVIKTLRDEYTIYPLQGQIGAAAKRIWAVMGFIAIPKPCNVAGEIIIAFKGTQGGLGSASVLAGAIDLSNPEWNTNCTFTKKKFSIQSMPAGQLHQGFFQTYLSMHEAIQSYLKKDELQGRKVQICGHSLGGALASICALYLKAISNIPNVNLFTLAAPAVGDAEWVRHFGFYFMKDINYQAYYINGDPVRKEVLGYCHYPAEDLAAFLGGIILKENSDRHYVETIRHAYHQHKGVSPSHKKLITCIGTDKELKNRTVSYDPNNIIAVTGHQLPKWHSEVRRMPGFSLN